MRQATFVLLLFVSCGSAAPAPNRSEPPAEDVRRIAEWPLGGDGGSTFKDKFGDPTFLKDPTHQKVGRTGNHHHRVESRCPGPRLFDEAAACHSDHRHEGDRAYRG